MKVLKFGGKALTEGPALRNSLGIIQGEKRKGDIAVVVSAVADSTDLLLAAIEKARNGEDFSDILQAFTNNHDAQKYNEVLGGLFKELEEKLLQIRKGNDIPEDDILAYGELCSSHFIVGELSKLEVPSSAVDARSFIKVSKAYNDLKVDIQSSKELSSAIFSDYDFNAVPIVTGFIASNGKKQNW